MQTSEVFVFFKCQLFLPFVAVFLEHDVGSYFESRKGYSGKSATKPSVQSAQKQGEGAVRPCGQGTHGRRHRRRGR